MPLLELRNLEARYGEIVALRGVSLTIDEGDFVAVLGANGAGKTTTLRAISGTVKTSGDVLVDGEKPLRHTPEAMARRGVAHVPEGRGVFFGLTVAEHFRLAHRGETLDMAAAFRYFPALEGLTSRRAGLLSGGEQQMLALGAARHAYVLETGRVVLAGESKTLRDDESVRRSYLGY